MSTTLVLQNPPAPTDAPRRRVVEVSDGEPYDLGGGATLRSAGLERFSEHPRAWLVVEGASRFSIARWCSLNEVVDTGFGALELVSMGRDTSGIGDYGQTGDRARVAVTVDPAKLADADGTAVDDLFGRGWDAVVPEEDLWHDGVQA